MFYALSREFVAGNHTMGYIKNTGKLQEGCKGFNIDLTFFFSWW